MAYVETQEIDGRYFKLTCTLASQSKSGNYSVVNWTAKSLGSEMTHSGGSVSFYVNGKAVTTFRAAAFSTGYSEGGTVTIYHNADGTMDDVAITISGTYYGTSVYAMEIMALPGFQRKHKLSISDTTTDLGVSITITVKEKYSGQKHSITVDCGTASKTICTNSTSGSYSFVPPVSWASQNKTGTTVKATYTIETYASNGSYVGSLSYSRTYSIPANLKPTCSITLSDATSVKDNIGNYLQDASKFKVDIDTTLSYGSEIASYSVLANGITYSKKSFTTDFIKKSGKLSITATVKDKRGRTGSATLSGIEVMAYTPPKISDVSLIRCDKDGNESKEGEYIKITFDSSILNLNNKNSTYHAIEYGEVSDYDIGAGTKVALFDTTNNFSVKGCERIFEVDTTKSYFFDIIAKDNFREARERVIALSIFTLFHFSSGGRGLGIGKLSEYEDLVDFGLDARFRKKVRIDSEWNDLTLNTDTFKYYNSDTIHRPMYCERGGIITIKGAVSPVKSGLDSFATYIIASGIPQELCPNSNLRWICQGTGLNKWLCTITTDGNVQMSRYGITESDRDTPLSTSAFIIFCVTYQV